MNFNRITENQSYRYIVEATSQLWAQGLQCPEVSEHIEFTNLNLNLKRCVTSGFGITGEGEFTGFLVTDGENSYRVITFYIDILSPKDTEVSDITVSLKELDPEHRKCDIRKPISMAILYWLECFGEIPRAYRKYC